MRFSSWLRAARSTTAATTTQRSARLEFQPLEDRTVPTTFVVRNFADGGADSLRQAVLLANANPGADVIRFAPAARDGTIALTSGELLITDAVHIDGPGAGRLAVSGSDSSRVFNVAAGAAVAIDDLTVTDGKASLRGGGIRNDGTLTLSRVVVSGNQVVGVAGFGPGVDAFGGGVFNAGNLTVQDTLFVGNRATGGDGIPATATTPGLPAAAALGGAIFSLGTATVPTTVTVTRSAFVGNEAVGGYAGVGVASRANGLGGAIMNDGNTFTVSDSLFHGNRAMGGASAQLSGGNGTGGAIAQSAFVESTFAVQRSTFTGNRAVGGTGGAGGASQFGRGGAIANLKAPFGTPPSTLRAVMRVTDSTIVGNEAVGGTGVVAGNGLGGGIANDNGGTMEVGRTLIAGNRAVGGVSVGGTSGSGLGGGVYNGQAINPAFGTTALSVNASVVAFNRADGGAATAGGTAGSGVGGGVYVSPGGIAFAFGTSIFWNDASTSDDDLFGILV